MITSVIQSCRHIDQWIPCQYTIFHGFLDTFANRCDELVGDCSSFDRVDKLKSFTSRFGFNFNHCMTILTSSSGLTDILTFSFSKFSNRFFVGNLWSTNICFYFEFTLHAIDQNFQMQLSHTPNNCLVRFGIGFNFKRRIFFRKTLQCVSHFFLIVFRLWLNSK